MSNLLVFFLQKMDITKRKINRKLLQIYSYIRKKEKKMVVVEN